MGLHRCFASSLKQDGRTTEIVNATSREVWGMIEATGYGGDKVTSRGTGLDRSKYASSSNEEPPALHHNWGKENNTVRHC